MLKANGLDETEGFSLSNEPVYKERATTFMRINLSLFCFSKPVSIQNMMLTPLSNETVDPPPSLTSDR